MRGSMAHPRSTDWTADADHPGEPRPRPLPRTAASARGSAYRGDGTGDRRATGDDPGDPDRMRSRTVVLRRSDAGRETRETLTHLDGRGLRTNRGPSTHLIGGHGSSATPRSM